MDWKACAVKGDAPEYTFVGNVLRFDGCLCVPKDEELIQDILKETHNTKFIIHLGSMKMYQDFRRQFWWEGMKRDVARFVGRCLVC